MLASYDIAFRGKIVNYHQFHKVQFIIVIFRGHFLIISIKRHVYTLATSCYFCISIKIMSILLHTHTHTY